MKILKRNILPTFLLLTASAVALPAIAASNTKRPTLPLKEFIQQAAHNDVTFETILIDQLTLKYRRDILLPDSDVIMDVKYKHNFYLNQNRSKPEAVVSLRKLFPYNGTQLSLSYNKTASGLTTTDTSNLQFLITQPIAQNAFGKGTGLQDEIIGIENDIRRYQIVEAYEDYLASLTAAYYNWYSAYENLKVGQSSYKSNQRLLRNILERQKQNIALPVDVNKIKLLLIEKSENLIVLQEIYDRYSNLIFKAIRNTGVIPYIPTAPGRPVATVKFEPDYKNFTRNSRTYATLNLLERQGTMQVKKAADDLLPSTNLLLGYQLEGKEWGIQDQERSYFAGISVHWPIGRTVDKARQSIAKIEHKKTVLSNQNKYEDLHTNLQNLYLQILREEKLIAIAKKKNALAKSVLKDETENYSYGKITLNDYIIAVNRVDQNRFSYTEHSVQLNKLLLEWLRLTDQLVNEKVLDKPLN